MVCFVIYRRRLELVVGVRFQSWVSGITLLIVYAYRSLLHCLSFCLLITISQVGVCFDPVGFMREKGQPIWSWLLNFAYTGWWRVIS